MVTNFELTEKPHPLPDPHPDPDPTPHPDPDPDLREVVSRLNKANGDLQQDNARLRQRLDAIELAQTYVPAHPDTPLRHSGPDGPDALETFILDGLDAEERDAPWTGTMVKAIKHVAPMFRDVARAEANGATWRSKVDDDFYGHLLERWGKPVTPRALRQVEKEYGKDIGELSRMIVQWPNGQVRPEYQQDFTKSFDPVAEALERKYQMSERTIQPQRIEQRAPTGDRGGGGRGPTSHPGKDKKTEVSDFVKEVQGI